MDDSPFIAPIPGVSIGDRPSASRQTQISDAINNLVDIPSNRPDFNPGALENVLQNASVLKCVNAGESEIGLFQPCTITGVSNDNQFPAVLIGGHIRHH